jgi:hypothetical protein
MDGGGLSVVSSGVGIGAGVSLTRVLGWVAGALVVQLLGRVEGGHISV